MTTASTTSGSTTAVEQTFSCNAVQVRITVEVDYDDVDRPRARAMIVAERVGTSACRIDYDTYRMTIADRRGTTLGVWNGFLVYVDDSVRIARGLVIPCDRPGPYVAVVTTGLNERFRSEITC